MLQLPPPDHHHQHLLDLPVLVLLLAQVAHDGVDGDLAADGEPPLELLLDLVEVLLLLLGGEALGPGQVAGLGGGEGRDLEQQLKFIFGSKRSLRSADVVSLWVGGSVGLSVCPHYALQLF